MSRREGFERWWAARNDVPPETMAQYRCDDDRQYRLPELSRKFRVWCGALDQMEAELDEKVDQELLTNDGA